MRGGNTGEVILSLVVMAHPRRADRAMALAEQVGARIVWDERDDEWDTGARALGAIDPGATHQVVLQDDAVPVPGFPGHAAAAIAEHPHAPVSFYLGRSRPPQWQRRIIRATLTADEHQAAWLAASTMLHGVAIALPVADIPPLLEWARRPRLPYDERIGTWYQSQDLPVLYTWPSLVDHADEPTLVTHHDGQDRTAGRVAWRTGTPSTWATPAVTI